MSNLLDVVAVFERPQQHQIRPRSLQIGSPRHIWTWGPQAVQETISQLLTGSRVFEVTLIFVAPFTIFSMFTNMFQTPAVLRREGCWYSRGVQARSFREVPLI